MGLTIGQLTDLGTKNRTEFKWKAHDYSGKSSQSQSLPIHSVFDAGQGGDRLLSKFLLGVSRNSLFLVKIGQKL